MTTTPKQKQWRLSIQMLNEIHDTIGRDKVMACGVPCVSMAVDLVAEKYIKTAYELGAKDAIEQHNAVLSGAGHEQNPKAAAVSPRPPRTHS